VPVIVTLAEQDMPVRKVLRIKPGSIIEFDQPFDADLALVVANRCIGAGQAVKVGENFGLRITQIGKIGNTIQALGGK
jgi:flagellar motor switch protein FliN/FliY